jgi:hypothetical protein
MLLKFRDPRCLQGIQIHVGIAIGNGIVRITVDLRLRKRFFGHVKHRIEIIDNLKSPIGYVIDGTVNILIIFYNKILILLALGRYDLFCIHLHLHGRFSIPYAGAGEIMPCQSISVFHSTRRNQ